MRFSTSLFGCFILFREVGGKELPACFQTFNGFPVIVKKVTSEFQNISSWSCNASQWRGAGGVSGGQPSLLWNFPDLKRFSSPLASIHPLG